MEINLEKYRYLKDGIPVTYKNEKGEIIRNKKIKVYDFDEPAQNDFLAVQQLWVEGKSKRKRISRTWWVLSMASRCYLSS
ncbi:MAG: hypothetical protein H6559_08625 [Lewinellaceae bacterium]|nr:hypothetical protein [Lewinellaceae bacterium]